MKKQAIIFDLDGTAVNSPKEILPPQSLKKAIESKKNNYYFSAATGRSLSWSYDVIEFLGLTDPCIVAGGTIIIDSQTRENLWQTNIEDQDLQEALDVFRQYPKSKMLVNDYSADDYYTGGFIPAEYSNTDPVYFLEGIHIPNQDAQDMFNKLSSVDGLTCLIFDSQIREGASDIHVINKEATKEQAIEQLLTMIDVSKDDAIGIGDGNNDLHLFNAVGHKVAMGNAINALKQGADQVIGAVNEDGLAKYFQSLGN